MQPRQCLRREFREAPERRRRIGWHHRQCDPSRGDENGSPPTANPGTRGAPGRELRRGRGRKSRGGSHRTDGRASRHRRRRGFPRVSTVWRRRSSRPPGARGDLVDLHHRRTRLEGSGRQRSDRLSDLLCNACQPPRSRRRRPPRLRRLVLGAPTCSSMRRTSAATRRRWSPSTPRRIRSCRARWSSPRARCRSCRRRCRCSGVRRSRRVVR